MTRDEEIFCWQVEWAISGLAVSSARRYLLLIDQTAAKWIWRIYIYAVLCEWAAASRENPPPTRAPLSHCELATRTTEGVFARLWRSCLRIGPLECMRFSSKTQRACRRNHIKELHNHNWVMQSAWVNPTIGKVKIKFIHQICSASQISQHHYCIKYRATNKKFDTHCVTSNTFEKYPWILECKVPTVNYYGESAKYLHALLIFSIESLII